ncbi:MAG: hypothetical protein DRJ41_04915 [Thermoprotei archaeon]|nr:MAG: hypothetical protein DRJ41_04915 [Thermoprotei archaeon]
MTNWTTRVILGLASPDEAAARAVEKWRGALQVIHYAASQACDRPELAGEAKLQCIIRELVARAAARKRGGV